MVVSVEDLQEFDKTLWAAVVKDPRYKAKVEELGRRLHPEAFQSGSTEGAIAACEERLLFAWSIWFKEQRPGTKTEQRYGRCEMREQTDAPTALKCREAANFLGVHPITLRRWAEAGLIQSWRVAGGWRRFKVADLARLRDGR